MAGQADGDGLPAARQRQQLEQSASSPSSSTGAGGFVLKNAKMGSASASTSPGSAGASASDPSSRAAGSMSSGASKDIILMADASVNLAEHVGHQVMVTGRMSGAAVGVAERFVPVHVVPVEQRLELERGQGRSFTVTKVSMISATCSTGS